MNKITAGRCSASSSSGVAGLRRASTALFWMCVLIMLVCLSADGFAEDPIVDLATVPVADQQSAPQGAPPIIYQSSVIKSGVVWEDSPDIAINSASNITLSENSVFIDPNNPMIVLNSNNSSSWPPPLTIYGTDYWVSTDGGQTWSGSPFGAHPETRADPATGIGLNGHMFLGYITATDLGQGAANSSDLGANWTHTHIAVGGGDIYHMLDKNHLWIDNSPGSAYEANLYSAWTNLMSGQPQFGEIEIAVSTDGNSSWSSPVVISSAVGAGSHNQGVNIQTGPAGEVYVAWAIYDWWPSDETALGFAKSLDGGQSWLPASRIITNIRGHRSTSLGGGKTMRHNSYPSMTVNQQTGEIFVVWTNIGVPGVNTGDPDIYMISSTDGGSSWSSPVRVNQDTQGNGLDQYFPWIACDPATGNLVCVFYDSRNFPSNDMVETFVAVSLDGGSTWEDFRVSDVAWAGDGISGFDGNYAGDYLGIDILENRVYPVWSDNRAGNMLAYVSPFEIDVEPCTEAGPWEVTWGDTLAQHAYWGDRTDDGYVFCGRVGPYDAAILGSDILMVKTDTCGSVLWARTYGGDSADFAYSMDVTSPDNGMIICGSTFSFGLGGTDIYIIKTNSSGDVEWTRTLGSPVTDYGEDIKQTSDGGYIVIGQMDGRDILIEKLNSSGNTVWSDTCFDFYGFEHYYPGEVIENSSGDFVVSGYGWDDDYDEYFVILFTWDSNGNQTGWHRYYMDHAHGYGLDQTSDGGYIVCGYLADTSGYTSMDILLLKVNSSFSQQWAKTYDADRGDAAFSVKQVDNGGYIATGEVSHGFYEDFNMYVLRTDDNGDEIWSKELGGALHDEGQCVNVTPDGGFILTGHSYSFDDAENGDFYMVKLEAEPAAPVLVSPANGQYWYSTGMSVALDWQDAAHADYYHVMVDNNSNFSSPVVDVDSLSASNYTTPTLGVSTYYWRVRGENETGYGPWSQVRSFEIRQPSGGGGGCPILFSYDGHGFRRENPLLTACEASGYTDIVTDYYHLTDQVANQDGRVLFRIQEGADEISYIHDLKLITVDHAPDVRVACAVNGDVMTYREKLAPVTAVDQNGNDRLAEVVAEDGLLFTSHESGHLIVTFPNTFSDLLSFSFTAMKKIIIIEDPHGTKVVPDPVTSSLRLEVLDDLGQWHEINGNIPSRDNPVSEFVFSELARVLTGDFITLRLSWDGGYSTDALCQYLPSGETPVLATRNVDNFERIFARPASENWQGFSGDEPLVLRQGDIFEFSFDDGEATTGSERDYIIRAVGRYEPASSALADGLPGKFALHDNYPNPFNPSTTIKYDLPVPMIVKIDIVNILGQVITTLVDGPQTAGSHTITWDGRDRRGDPVASGIYLYRFTSDAYNVTKKMLLIK